jgi:hypothetical protein
MNNGKRIRSRRDAYKVATRLRIPNFYCHHTDCVAQVLDRETNRRFEKRTGYGSRAVLYIQNFYVNAGA